MADHLITRAKGSPLKIEVPFVCKEVCALGCFSTYPTTRGVEYNRHGYLIIRDDQRSEFPSLLREWLYFGLLQEFLDEPIEISDYVRDHPNNGQVLDTSPLLTHMDNWHRRHLRNTLNRFVADRAYCSIEIAANQCRFLEGASVSADCEVLPTIFLSIRFLIDSLVVVAADRLVDMPTDFENLHSLDYHTKDWAIGGILYPANSNTHLLRREYSSTTWFRTGGAFIKRDGFVKISRTMSYFILPRLLGPRAADIILDAKTRTTVSRQRGFPNLSVPACE